MRKQIGNNKVAVVTGGSSGIGKELIKRLHAYGYTVACVSRSEPQGTPCDFFACDLSDTDALHKTAEAIREKYGRVDLLINNAGLGISGATELLPEDKIRYVAEVDYFAPLLFTRALLPAFSAGGKVVMISSACALFALPFRGVYCSAKAAVNMLAFSLRMELKPCGINVVCICPGDIKSEFTAHRLKYTQTNERYGNAVVSAQQKVDTREHKRMNVRACGKKIAAIAVKKKKALYIIGAKYKLLYACSKLFSQNFMLKMTQKMFGGKK
ncbi:MAG: SDR family NAD(P)-dependent oxidoreductase [Clostridia bacterium]|jgi:short-subunit dehydrogenase|nr:SDR family NAD(P)-dependent oxidoreductase [Clostridia bacterium]